MKIKENPNIVIAGAWNLNILTPAWFAQEFPDLLKQKEVPAQATDRKIEIRQIKEGEFQGSVLSSI